MPAYYSILFSLLTLFFLSACGGPATSRVELSSNLSFLTADHEVIFLGKHYLSNTKFSVIADTDGFDVDLLLGKWELAIVAWEKDGSGRFTGTTKCAVRENVDISGAAVKLDFNISISGCNSDFFRRPGYLATSDGQLQTIKIKDCTNLATVTNGGSSCTSPGAFSHFRLAYIPHSNGIKTNAQAPQFISGCHAFNATTGLKFPAHARVYLNFDLITYSEATCATEVSRFNLPMGIA